MSHLLFNINTQKEWTEHLVPGLKVLISYDEGMEIFGDGNTTLLDLDLKYNTITWKDKSDGTIDKGGFDDFFLLDDEDRLLHQKTKFLKDLHNELFIN